MLITTIDQVRDHVPDVGNMIYENIKTFLLKGELKLSRMFGVGLWGYLTDIDEDSSDADKQCLYWAEDYICYFAIYKRTSTSNILLSDNGAQVAWSDTHRPAMDWQIKEFKYGILDGMHTAFENLLIALDAANPSDWANCPIKLKQSALLVRSSEDLTGLITDISPRFFALLAPEIEKEQRTVIEPMLGDRLPVLLAKINDNTLTFDELKLVERCRYIIAKAVFSRIIVSMSEEDFPVSLSRKIDNSDKDAISIGARRDADVAINSLTNDLDKLNTDIQGEIKPVNDDTTRKTFRA